MWRLAIAQILRRVGMRDPILLRVFRFGQSRLAVGDDRFQFLDLGGQQIAQGGKQEAREKPAGPFRRGGSSGR
jgi:hypothetical protein